MGIIINTYKTTTSRYPKPLISSPPPQDTHHLHNTQQPCLLSSTRSRKPCTRTASPPSSLRVHTALPPPDPPTLPIPELTLTAITALATPPTSLALVLPLVLPLAITRLAPTTPLVPITPVALAALPPPLMALTSPTS